LIAPSCAALLLKDEASDNESNDCFLTDSKGAGAVNDDIAVTGADEEIAEAGTGFTTVVAVVAINESRACIDTTISLTSFLTSCNK